MRTNDKEIKEICNLLTGATRPVSNTDESSSNVLQLEQDREILKSFIVRHHPEMQGWVVKNFGKGNEI